MCVRVNYYYGKDMVTSYKCGYETIFDLSQLDENTKDSIQPDELYTVKEKYSDWDYCGGLTGDSEGEKHIVLKIEKTPETIKKIFKQRNNLLKKIQKYQIAFMKDETI